MPNLYENQTFEDQTVQLDGNKYVNCIFRHCRLQYGGLGVVTLQDSKFDKCSWIFTDAAARTINFMAGLYHGTGIGGKELIKKTFEDIRKGRLPEE